VPQHILVEHVSLYNPEAVERLRLLWQGLMLRGVDSVTAQEQAGHLIYGEVQRQALMMAFDNFWLIGLISLACLPLILLMRKAAQTATVGGHGKKRRSHPCY
jgi:DHA2 family multidrug resistance protein